MMWRDWKPGDVAMVTTEDGSTPAVRDANDDWTVIGPPFGSRESGWIDDDAEIIDTRPLVLIDPEDREQVDRLYVAYLAANGNSGTSELQTALREFANPTPPKPDEPTGLGAVVVDADGDQWVRTDPDSPAWTRWDAPLTRVSYDRIAAVRVLSDGVTP